MKILIFLHGTLIMHHTGVNVDRLERVKQVQRRDPEVYEYENYVPVGNSLEKVLGWQEQGAQIIYLSSHEDEVSIQKDQIVLDKYGFPRAQIYYRTNGKSYAQVAEEIMPDILIEDDCESIGGTSEMTITNITAATKEKIKSIVVKEFSGIDNLPDSLEDLLNY